jgi:CRISPR-associated protein Csx3
MTTYQIGWEGDVLKVGFVDRNADGTAIAANGDEIVRDAAARLHQMEDAGELRGGDLLKIDGRISVLVSYVIAHRVAHLYRAIAISDTRLNAYVVAVSTAAEYPVGSRIDFASGEVQQFPDNPEASPSFSIDWEDGVLHARINNGVQVDGDRIVRDAVAQLANLIESGQLPGGKQILKIKGRTTVLASCAIASQVAHLYGGVAVFDPRLGDKGLDKYVVTVSHSKDCRVGETVDVECEPQPAVKVVLCGPANTGKTVLRDALKKAILKLENAPKDFFVISGCPDGDGSWFCETAQKYPELAQALKKEYKARFTPKFARDKARDIAAIKNSLLLFDVGGKIPTEENQIIMSQATHAVVLVKNDRDVADWQEFCDKKLEKPLPFIAIICSDFEGTRDTITDASPVLTGSVHRLARGKDASSRPTVQALAELLVNLVDD